MGRLAGFARRWETWCVVLLALAAALRSSGSWIPTGDNALTTMWVDAVGRSGTPLTGGDARFGWNHLGPWLYWLLAVPYRLFGSSPVGILVGAAAINVVGVVVIARSVRDTAGEAAAACWCAATLWIVLASPRPLLTDPWNPIVVQLPFVACVACCWAIISGHLRWWPWLIGGLTLAAQSHIVFLPPSALLVVVAATASWRRHRTEIRLVVRRTILVAFLGWLPPLIDLLIPGRRNALRILRYVTERASADQHPSWRQAFNVVLRETGLSAGWLGQRPPLVPVSDAFGGGVGVGPGLGLAVLLGAGVVAWRRRDRLGGRLFALVSALMILAPIQLRLMSGPLYPYVFGWVSNVGMICWLAAGFVLVRAIGKVPVAAIRHAWVAPVVVAAMIVAVSGHARLPRSPLERPGDGAVVAQLADDAMRRLDIHERYRIAVRTDRYNSIYAHGVLLRLLEDGYQIAAEPLQAGLFGRALVADDAATRPIIAVVAPWEGPQPGDVVLAAIDPLSPVDRTEAAGLSATLAAGYRADGFPVAANIVETADGRDVLFAAFVDGDPSKQTLLNRLADLRDAGRSIAVVERPPSP